MTVPYNRDVASATSWASIRILLRWRGSIWKSVFPELTMWMIIYYSLFFSFYFTNYANSLKFHNTTSSNAKGSILDDVPFIAVCRNYATDFSVPLVMLLSFFTTKAFERWQYIFNNLAYAENLALTVNAFIKGSDRITQLARQTIMRQAILAQVLVYRDVSISVRKRFPSIESLVEADMLKQDELRLLENSFNPYNVFSTPFCWITTLLTKLKQDGNITGEPTFVSVFTEVKDFRKKLETVYNYDCVPIPLAYPQIVSVAVRIHCIVTIIGGLFIFSKTESIWKLNSAFGLVQGPEFLIYLAWLKVAEILANPLGEDDDDLELNHIIDRNNFISRCIVESHDHCPLLEETDQSAHPKYDEHVQNLGGASHRLQGSAVGSKVDVGRMVEVEPTRKPLLKKRQCFKSISNLLGKELNNDNSSTLSIIDHGEIGSTSNIHGGVFCVEVPSLYDSRSLRTLTDEEMDARFTDRISKTSSLYDISPPSDLSVRHLSSSIDVSKPMRM
ncbi:hypothetical protein PFISCL1PPCAC_27410 [Pristionchus fissidentatus]|uniref:Bestrophin homolog n=1 Tax=Pristionchus fissidentatus TaxID=1538716 RepID=A0AAV5WZD8_9BILA|nr:hypothetical protein PFISCL1PPCAC_27410 [Pristionchus fissidentatus]